MDRKAEPGLQSSEEEGGDEQDTNASRYATPVRRTLRDDANDAPVDTVFHPLVLFADTAYGCDPRIKKFKDEEKARKESEKKAKADAKKRGQEEKEKVSVL